MRIDDGGMHRLALHHMDRPELRRPSHGSGQIDGGKGHPPERDDLEFGYFGADGSQYARQREVLQEGEDGATFLRERFYPVSGDRLLSTDAGIDTVVIETGDGDDVVAIFSGRPNANGDRVVDVAINGVLYTLTLAPGQTLEVRTSDGDDGVFVDPETSALLGSEGADTPVYVDTGTGADFTTPGAAATDPDAISQVVTAGIPQILAVDAESPPAVVEAPTSSSLPAPPIAVPPSAPDATTTATSVPASSSVSANPVPATPAITTAPDFVPNAGSLVDSPVFQVLPQHQQALLRGGLEAGGDSSSSWLARAGTLVGSAEFQAMTPEQQSAAIGSLTVEQVFRSGGENQLVGPFPSADAAARAALDFANQQTAGDDLERGGLIFFDPDSGSYYVSTPVTGDTHDIDPATFPEPSDISDLPVVAFYHTHPDMASVSGLPQVSVDTNGDGFSDVDVSTLESGRYGSTAYLGSSTGIVFKLVSEGTSPADPTVDQAGIR
ncbi:hypothetical protein [Luteimonas cucumeris]|nr:hypothetical protein [Luteimonas cucumeris]